MIDFNKNIDRTGTNSAKYDEMNDRLGNHLIHCGVADMDFASPEPIITALNKVVQHGIFGYTNLPANYACLVQEWMLHQYSCPIETDWVVFSPRINIALNIIVETLTNPGDKILVHAPAYPALTSAVMGYGRRLIESPLIFDGSHWKMNFEQMEQQIDSSVKMILLCNPHNPTGRVWTYEELKQLADLCITHDLLLVTDDIHSDIVRVKGSYTPVFQISEQIKTHSIICNSITKTFNVPGIILSNMIIPNETLREQIKSHIHRLGLHNPNIFAAAIIEPAYKECVPWLCKANKYLWENQDFLYKFVKERLPLFDISIPEATYLSWISFKQTGCSDSDMETFFLQKAKVGVYMGSHFGTSGKGFIRINVATPRGRLEELLLRIAKAYIEEFIR